MDQGLGDRLFNFTVDIIHFLGTFKNSSEVKIIRYQLAKSSSSSGATLKKLNRLHQSRFANKMKISLREMRNQIIG